MSKYRCYEFCWEGVQVLVKLTYINKLPIGSVKGLSKENKEVWVKTISEFNWMKICKSESDITFGTGTK